MFSLSRFKELISLLSGWFKALFYKKGLLRKISGFDKIYLFTLSGDKILSEHEAAWWQRLMREVKAGDTAVDVGAYVGICSIILAQKVGDAGKVISFEPNPKNLFLFKKNLALNGFAKQVEIFADVIGCNNRPVLFVPQAEESHVASPAVLKSKGSIVVASKTLDDVFLNRKVDILKIDVEGYEYNVLLGAKDLLSRKEGFPRFIFVEAHPYAWKKYGTDSHKIKALLEEAGYAVEMPCPEGANKLEDSDFHWAIFASKS